VSMQVYLLCFFWSKVLGQPLNLLGCVKPIHELSKRPLKPIIYDLVLFRPNQLLTPWMSSSLIALSSLPYIKQINPLSFQKNKNKLAPFPNYLLPIHVCSCSSAEGNEGVEEGCGYKIGGKLRLSALVAGDVGRKKSHWSCLPSQDRRMVATLQPKGAPLPVYDEFDRCLFSSNRWIW
jgi:hypothetical protein